MGGVGLGWGVRMDVNEIDFFCENSKKKFFLGGGSGGGGRGVSGTGLVGVGGQGGCERN